MVEKTCKNCEYWHTYKNEHTGKCRNDKFVYIGGFDDIETPIDGLGYSDCESYNASFETGEQFGCIHFKEGENE
jgi:hypothetical protein